MSNQRNPQGFNQQKRVAKDGGSVANFYKVKDANHIVLIDSFGNDPQKEDKKNYILKRKGSKKNKSKDLSKFSFNTILFNETPNEPSSSFAFNFI